MHSRIYILTFVLAIFATSDYGADKPKKAPELSALDKYLQEALKQQSAPVQPSAGSLWSPASRLTDIGSDVRAAQADDLVTIVVAESASAVATEPQNLRAPRQPRLSSAPWPARSPSTAPPRIF